MPPPPRKILPKARPALPPPRKAVMAPLPATTRVKVVRAPDGYKIVTSVMGLIVGGRLDKGKSTWYPDFKASGLTLELATERMKIWDKFLAEQDDKKKKHEHTPTTTKKAIQAPTSPLFTFRATEDQEGHSGSG